MKRLFLLPTFLLLGCHAVTQEVIEPSKVVVVPSHQQPTIPFFETERIDVTNNLIRMDSGRI